MAGKQFPTEVDVKQAVSYCLQTLHIRRCASLGATVGKIFNPLTPNDPYSGRTAPLTSKRCILNIYSTNTGTEYFKYCIYCPFFSSSKCSLFHNSNVFGACIIHILYTDVLKFKKNNSGAKSLKISVKFMEI